MGKGKKNDPVSVDVGQVAVAETEYKAGQSVALSVVDPGLLGARVRLLNGDDSERAEGFVIGFGHDKLPSGTELVGITLAERRSAPLEERTTYWSHHWQNLEIIRPSRDFPIGA